MEIILSPINVQHALLFSENVLMFSKIPEQHRQHADYIL